MEIRPLQPMHRICVCQLLSLPTPPCILCSPCAGVHVSTLEVLHEVMPIRTMGNWEKSDTYREEIRRRSRKCEKARSLTTDTAKFIDHLKTTAHDKIAHMITQLQQTSAAIDHELTAMQKALLLEINTGLQEAQGNLLSQLPVLNSALARAWS